MVECAMRHRQPPEACKPRDCEPQILLPTHAHDALHVWALRICTAGQQAWWVIWGCGGGAPNNKGLAHRTTSVGVAGAKIETHGVYSPGRVCEPGVAVALTLDTPAPTPCKTTNYFFFFCEGHAHHCGLSFCMTHAWLCPVSSSLSPIGVDNDKNNTNLHFCSLCWYLADLYNSFHVLTLTDWPGFLAA